MQHMLPTGAPRQGPDLGPRSRILGRLLADSNLSVRDSPDVPPPERDFVRIGSYGLPALFADDYTLSVTQTVSRNGSQLDAPLENKKYPSRKFTVDAPRWSIPPADILSVYPPQGVVVPNTVLAHITFSEPHLPWERDVQQSPSVPGRRQPIGSQALGVDQSVVPWMALLAFENAELLSVPSSLAVSSTSSTTRSFLTTPADALACHDIKTPISFVPEELTKCKDAVELICITSQVMTSLVYDDLNANGKPSSLERYSYLAHQRQSGPDSDDISPGLTSIVISHRTGPPSVQATTPIVFHLVSLEGWHSVSAEWLNADSRPVALVSLYSWTAAMAPSSAAKFEDVMRNLGAAPAYKTGPVEPTTPAGSSYTDDRMLRLPHSQLAPLDSSDTLPAHAASALKQRLSDGYSPVKYRLPTGEVTAAFYRGPLSPLPVPFTKAPGPGFFPNQSSFGKDLEIMDPILGLPDISYSAAWANGRLLGYANREFSTALVNFRSEMINVARSEFYSGAPSGVNIVDQILNSSVINAPPPLDNANAEFYRNAWQRSQPLESTLKAKGMDPTEEGTQLFLALCAEGAVLDAAKSGSLNSDIAPPYNEVNSPSHSLWPTLLKHILDLKFFAGIAMNHLISDPACLPPESIRFFYIDKNWVDACVDGFLSVGNTLQVRMYDPVKSAILVELNRYESSVIDITIAPHKPQIPRFGMLVRSLAISTWPDLQLSAPFPSSGWKGKKVEILHSSRLTPDTLLILLDRRPEDVVTVDDIPADASDSLKAELQKDVSANTPVYMLQGIIFQQPAHHQGFSLGELTGDALEIDLVKIDPNVQNKSADEFSKTHVLWDALQNPALPGSYKRGDPIQAYDWDTKLLRVMYLVNGLRTALGASTGATGPNGTKAFQDISAALLAIELGDSTLNMNIATLREGEPTASVIARQSRPPLQPVVSRLAPGEPKPRHQSQTPRKKVVKNVVNTIVQEGSATSARKCMKAIASFAALGGAGIDTSSLRTPLAPYFPLPIDSGSIKTPDTQVKHAPLQCPTISIGVWSTFIKAGSQLYQFTITDGQSESRQHWDQMRQQYLYLDPADIQVVIIVDEKETRQFSSLVVSCPYRDTEPTQVGQSRYSRLLSAYTGLGPQILNKPRLRAQLLRHPDISTSGEEFFEIEILPRENGRILPLSALNRMVMVIPQVNIDASKEESLVRLTFTFNIMAEGGAEESSMVIEVDTVTHVLL